MSFGSGHSKLIQLPPTQDEEDSEEEGAGYVEASSAEELMQQVDLDAHVLDRVLYRGDVFANYRILGFIGAGGMGEIYAAERLDDDSARRHPVALKVLSRQHAGDEDLLRRLEREAELCGAITSKYVVRIYEYGVDDHGRGFVAMELLDGEELFDRMRHHKLFPLRKLAEMALQLLAALHDIHKARIIHRDLKPENIFLTKPRRKRSSSDDDERVKLLDFGIARRFEDPNDPLLKQRDILATPQYMSPEQTRSPDVDHRSDIYSLGVILYECAAGNPPFDKETPYATMMAHQEETPTLLPSTLDPEFCEIIYKALAKRPSERWQSAREMGRVIYRWLEETSWVDELPGAPEEDAEDDFFDDLLTEHPPTDSVNFIPPDETPMFGQRQPRPLQNNAPTTDSSTPAAGILKPGKRRAPSQRRGDSFDAQRGVFEEEGAAPPSTRQRQRLATDLPSADDAASGAAFGAVPLSDDAISRSEFGASPAQVPQSDTSASSITRRAGEVPSDPVPSKAPAAPQAPQQEEPAQEASPSRSKKVVITLGAAGLIAIAVAVALLAMSGNLDGLLPATSHEATSAPVSGK